MLQRHRIPFCHDSRAILVTDPRLELSLEQQAIHPHCPAALARDWLDEDGIYFR
jgi:hypothetical protein